jgi:hypothetical protein
MALSPENQAEGGGLKCALEPEKIDFLTGRLQVMSGG